MEFALDFSLREIVYFYLLVYLGSSLGTDGSSRLLFCTAGTTLGGILFCEFLGYKICFIFC